MRYLEELKALNLPPDQYAVFGSGPMAIRGIRPNDYIDIIVSPELWERIEGDRRKDEKGMVKLSANVEATRTMPYLDDIDGCIADADIINGIPYARLVHIVEWKKRMGREKDVKDVELILEYIKTSDEQL